MSFVHTHLHSEYSLLEASCRIPQIVERAKDCGMPAVAITDYGNMFGAVEFYFECQKQGIKPIIGLEVYIAPNGRLKKERIKGEPNRRLVLLAKNYEGYKNLCQISSCGYREGFYYVPRVDYEILENFSSDLIALSAGLNGDIPWTFLQRGEEEALKKIQYYKDLYKKDFYLELNRTGLDDCEKVNEFLIKASKDLNVPLVATNNIHYLKQEDQVIQEVLICIGSNKTLDDPNRYSLGSDQFYFKSPDQMKELFKDCPEACENTLKIAEKCNVEFQLKDSQGQQIYHLPSYPVKKGVSLKKAIKELSEEGLKKRLSKTKDITKEQLKEYKERLNYELEVIDEMNFNGYFLIVQDFVNWAKNNGVPVGPARGSGAGSLVAYSLFITDLDPIEHKLLFERFLNPERVSMPDFDIDFCQDKRQKVIDYVTQKYSEESVSQIITYGKLQARAAIRDVGRVLGMSYAEVDRVAKLIPDILGISLKEALEKEDELKKLVATDPQVKRIIELAQKLEGIVRHASIHAAGVVIADGSLMNYAPLYKGNEGENVIQYDMKNAEKIGLIKFDFLGLKTLTHIKEALSLVKKTKNKNINIDNIKLSDPGIYDIFQKGDTVGVFQFEANWVTQLMKEVKPDTFQDLVLLNALNRPGPMEKAGEYVERRFGRQQIDYIFPELEDILKETYGIIIYQEQVQLIAQRIASYSLAEADILRRAMGKKIKKEMDEQKSRFLKGAAKNKFDPKKSEALFDLMAEFAKYGFNKSHAAAYCVISAQTAYLKHYFPTEFFASLLSTEMSDTDKIVKCIKDAQRHKIEVLPPSVNYSKYKFTVEDNKIVFSLGAIKGVGKAAVEAILEAVERQPNKKFENLNQFFNEVDSKGLNKKTIESLIKAGALDGFGFHRAQLYNGFMKCLEQVNKSRKAKEMGQGSLFSEEEQEFQLDDCSPWSLQEQLAYEKEALGFYLSAHPLRAYASFLQTVATPISEVYTSPTKTTVSVGGIIEQMRELLTKKGKRMAFAELEDLTEVISLVIFPNTFTEFEFLLKSGKPLLCSGTLDRKQDPLRPKLIVDKIEALEDRCKTVQRVVFCISEKNLEKLEEFKGVLERYPGNTPFQLNLNLNDLSTNVNLDVGEKGIHFCSEMLDSMETLMNDKDCVKIY